MLTIHSAARRVLPFALAGFYSVALCTSAWAGPGDVNSINNGQTIVDGTYYNTPGSNTTFVNTSGSGLHLHAGDTVRGLEVGNPANPTGSLTGNGGWLHFSAPGQVVRLDGNIDVNGILNGGNLGNGGKVTIDSAYLIQNGTIFANGKNAGTVSFNVGSLTMGPGASIQAKATTGNGGKIDIKATGVVDIAAGAMLDSSGKVIGNYDTNVIRIQGGIVNLNGVVSANGLNASSSGGRITLISTDHATALNQVAMNNATGMFSAAEKTALINRDASLRASSDGDVIVGSNATLSARGADGANGSVPITGGSGGFVALVAEKSIDMDGFINANGGNGGTNSGTEIAAITTDAFGKTSQVSQGKPGANGGYGGTIHMIYKESIDLDGSIKAKGGDGGQGGNASAFANASFVRAFGGAGGDGGQGGYVQVMGPNSPHVYPTINVAGGSGGSGGTGRYTANYFYYVNYGPSGKPGQPGYICYCGGEGTPGGGGGTPPIVVPPLVIPPVITPPDTTGLFQEGRPKPVEFVPAIAPPNLLVYSPNIFPKAPILVATVPKPPAPLYTQIFIPAPQPVVTIPTPQRRSTVRGYW